LSHTFGAGRKTWDDFACETVSDVTSILHSKVMMPRTLVVRTIVSVRA